MQMQLWRGSQWIWRTHQLWCPVMSNPLVLQPWSLQRICRRFHKLAELQFLIFSISSLKRRCHIASVSLLSEIMQKVTSMKQGTISYHHWKKCQQLCQWKWEKGKLRQPCGAAVNAKLVQKKQRDHKCNQISQPRLAEWLLNCGCKPPRFPTRINQKLNALETVTDSTDYNVSWHSQLQQPQMVPS
jgi:hypothetical protein